MTAQRIVTATLMLGLAPACDASYAQFLGAIPVSSDGAPENVHVLIGIDGLSRAAFDRARAMGAFADYADADLITPFPGTSDYVWTRVLRAGPVPGYEIQYFDPGKNQLEKEGLLGVLEHPLREGIAGTMPCYRRFDFLGNGDLWMFKTYLDPESALPETMDAMFNVLAVRARRQSVFLAYLMNVDVLGHHGGIERATAALVEIDRRIKAFKARHTGQRFAFTIFGDHGNTHVKADLVDPRQLLREAGIEPVTSLQTKPPEQPEAVPVVHVRVTYVALHTHAAAIPEVAARASRHPWVDLAVAPLDAAPSRRFGVWRAGELFVFTRSAEGEILLDDPARWRSLLGIELGPRLTDDEAFALTAAGPYPDLFYRVATAFTDGTTQFPAEVILSLPDNIASYGFHAPGTGADLSVDGFHGSLSRLSTLSVLASEFMPLPEAVRADTLGDLFPRLSGLAE